VTGYRRFDFAAQVRTGSADGSEPLAPAIPARGLGV